LSAAAAIDGKSSAEAITRAKQARSGLRRAKCTIELLSFLDRDWSDLRSRSVS